MDLRAKCAAIIPCFNEQATIASVARSVSPQVGHVIVIDDGSTDRTALEAEKAGAEVIRHASNKGKGQALRAGMLRARELNFEWALTLDGDGQHTADDIPKFFDCISKTSAKLVVGNRMSAAHKMPWLRRVVNRWVSRRLSAAAGQKFPDSQCGFRLVDLQAWSELQLRTTRFEVESEWLLAFARAGFRVEFVPIQVIYKDEQSKIHPIRDTIRWFRWWNGRE
jgi:glycosyltransferase involved in cell wall biosynthesis